MSIGTAFYPRQEELNRKHAWGEWSGYLSAQVYADFHDIEYAAIREAAAVIDTSPLYKYRVHGPDAGRLLDRIVTRNIASLKVDQVLYTPWCDEDGKVLDDGTVTRLAENEYRVTAADPCHRWFLLNATGPGRRGRGHQRVARRARAPGQAQPRGAGGGDRRGLGRGRVLPASADARSRGVDVSVTRTGYTGDRGYELWIPAEGALAVWDAVFAAGRPYGIHPVGIRAMDVARVEAGLILIEAEYTSAMHAIAPEQNYSPFEIGLGRLVQLDKPAVFTGRRALLAERAAGGPARRLVGLELEWAGIEAMYAKHGLAPLISPFVERAPVPVYKGDRRIGRATSITWGTTIKKMVGFGSVDAAHAKPGARLSVEYSVEGERGAVEATVVPLPFLDLERKRT